MKVSKSFTSIGSFALMALLTCASFAQQAPSSTDGPQQVAGNVSAQPAAAPSWINFVLIGGIIIFMWLFVFRPQSKRAKEQKDFLSSLTSGMEVITSGGMIGTVVEVKDNIVSLNLGSSTVKVLKSSISGKLNATTAEVVK